MRSPPFPCIWHWKRKTHRRRRDFQEARSVKKKTTELYLNSSASCTVMKFSLIWWILHWGRTIWPMRSDYGSHTYTYIEKLWESKKCLITYIVNLYFLWYFAGTVFLTDAWKIFVYNFLFCTFWSIGRKLGNSGGNIKVTSINFYGAFSINKNCHYLCNFGFKLLT